MINDQVLFANTNDDMQLVNTWSAINHSLSKFQKSSFRARHLAQSACLVKATGILLLATKINWELLS